MNALRTWWDGRRARARADLAAAFLANPDGWHTGWDLRNASGVRSGRLYPLLTEFLNEGWLVDAWIGPHPPRRHYRLTPAGYAALAEQGWTG